MMNERASSDMDRREELRHSQSSVRSLTSSHGASPYLNNATLLAPVAIDTSAPPAIRDRQIARALHTICPSFFGSAPKPDDEGLAKSTSSESLSSVQTRKLTVQQLGGGLSNHLFVASVVPDDEQAVDVLDCSFPTLLVRVYVGSQDATSIVDRVTENKIMAWLSSQDAAPIYYGSFINGRVEEFYDGYRPLSWTEMPRFGRSVARAMAELHAMQAPDGLLDSDLHGAHIWHHVDTWIRLALNAPTNDHARGDSVLEQLHVNGSLTTEWAWLKDQLRSPRHEQVEPNREMAMLFSREVVFTHMDCQSLNILIPRSATPSFASHSSNDSSSMPLPPLVAFDSKSDEQSDSSADDDLGALIHLIDFEYAGLNPRAADIANTFCEYCDMNNFHADFDTQYPSPKQQDTFLIAYIRRVKPELARTLDTNGTWEHFLEVMRDEVGKHTLLSHLSWAVWAVAQSYLSSIEFNYLEYAKLRMQGYYFFKKRHFGND